VVHNSNLARNSRPVWIIGFCLLLLLPAASQRAAAQSGSILRIYLARHGQTDWNLEGRTQGGTDTSLNATGRQQALQLKTWLKDIQFTSVYSSTLSRSRETAEIVRGPVRLSSLPGLGERRFGKFEGLLTSDPQAGPEFERRRWTPDDSLDGGESLNAFAERVHTTIDGIRKQHRSGTILIVGHANTNQMILRILFNLTVDQMRTITQDNNELYLIELESGKIPRLWKLITEANLKDL
jgi:2,3-bisphosphoglycerate-dependent phosphoglycerate mutase